MQKTLSIIDLGAIRRNAERIKQKLQGRKLFAVVKADAYGHGAEQVARSIEDLIDGFCVAICDEGINLRVAGITKPILVFTPPLDNGDVLKCLFYSLDVTVNSIKTAELAQGLPCHIKVNTGMNRSGCNISELDKILQAVRPENISGVYSHLFAPDSPSDSFRQLKLFERAENAVKAVNPQACAHLSASGGFLRGGDYLKDGVRCGILLYGYAPDGFSSYGFSPALKVYARRTQVTPFIGGGVGYNRADRRYNALSVYRLGYADGFFRGVPLGEKTLCMDAFLKNGGGDLECVLSDADDYAHKAGTISYEILTSVTRRSERIYIR